MGTLFRSATSFMQLLIDPNEFLVIQDRMFASFNNINTDLLWVSLLTVAGVFVYFLRFADYLDVLALGRDHAVNLGVDYDRVVSRLFVIVAALVSIATALVDRSRSWVSSSPMSPTSSCPRTATGWCRRRRVVAVAMLRGQGG